MFSSPCGVRGGQSIRPSPAPKRLNCPCADPWGQSIRPSAQPQKSQRREETLVLPMGSALRCSQNIDPSMLRSSAVHRACPPDVFSAALQPEHTP